MDKKNETWQKIWELQGDLFNAQRELITWFEDKIPPKDVIEYNLKVLKINHILERIKELEKQK